MLRFPSLDKNEKVPPEQQFSTYLKSRHRCGDRYTADLGRHMFSSDDLPATTEHKDEYGGRSSVGQPGYLIYGPYIPFKEAGTYTVELSYFVVQQEVETLAVADAGHTYEMFDDKSLKSRLLKFTRSSNLLVEDEVAKPVLERLMSMFIHRFRSPVQKLLLKQLFWTRARECRRCDWNLK